MADRHVPRNYPRNNCWTYFGSSRLLVSNVANRGGETSLRFGIEASVFLSPHKKKQNKMVWRRGINVPPSPPPPAPFKKKYE